MIPTLDGPVLVVLARTTRPLTGLEIHRLTGTGSPNGIRLALARLVRQGVVLADERSAAVFYEANHEHLAWTAVETLTSMRRTVLERIREELSTWHIQPVHASIFGSTARGDGDADSDIDVLLIRPANVRDDDDPTWLGQIDVLEHRVEMWTGNRCQGFHLDLDRLAQHVDARDPLVDEWRRDSITLAGNSIQDLLRH